MRAPVFILLIPLLVTSCSQDDGSTIRASGTIEGTDITIGSEVAGPVGEVRVSEGSRVKAGDTLVLVNDTEYQLQLKQAESAAAAAEAQYRLAVKGSRKEDILQAEAVLKAAEADFQRVTDLLASKTVTQKQFDDARARYVAAEQTLRKLNAGLRDEEIAMARAKRDQAEAVVEQLRKKAGDCIIVAPSAGTITLRAIEPGELVGPGSLVLRLTNLDIVKLTIYVRETELGRIRIGQEAGVSIDSYPERKFKGRVVYISPKAEFTPKNVQTKEERTKLVFAVKIEVENPDGALKPGLPADAELHTNDDR